MTSNTIDSGAELPEWADLDPGHVLTPRQRKVLHFIRAFVQRRGYPPSMREIGKAAGLRSTSGVSHQLSTLQDKGYLHRDVGRPRTVEVRLPGHPAARPDQDQGWLPGAVRRRRVAHPLRLEHISGSWLEGRSG